MTMRTIKTSTGVDIPLDGDILAIMETLYREVPGRHLRRQLRERGVGNQLPVIHDGEQLPRHEGRKPGGEGHDEHHDP